MSEKVSCHDVIKNISKLNNATPSISEIISKNKQKDFEFVIPGEIVGKARPRMNTRTGKAYTPTKSKYYEYLVKKFFFEKYRDSQISSEEAIRLTINVYMEIPKSVSKTKKNKMLEDEIKPIKKPDIDNIAKAILDGLNKLAYHDDTQVVELIIRKYYAENPSVHVRMEVI